MINEQALSEFKTLCDRTTARLCQTEAVKARPEASADELELREHVRKCRIVLHQAEQALTIYLDNKEANK